MTGYKLFFTGIVSSADSGTYQVSVDPSETGMPAVMQGIPLSHVLASAVGFKESPGFTPGSAVLCARVGGERCFILGIIPDGDIAAKGFYNRATPGTFDGAMDEVNNQGYSDQLVKLKTLNHLRPTDIIQGDYALSNEFGVMLGLFQLFAELRGSELAKVQCFFLDDLVRIISHNFQHWTSLGEFNIWHDGKSLQAEFGGTHLSQESFGTPAISSFGGNPSFEEDGGKPEPDDSKDFYKEKEERTKGVERLKMFFGRLADLFHLFVVRPGEDKRALNGEVQGDYDTGLFDVHVSATGGLSIRSVDQISLEKTNWIRVPHRVRTPEDPEGDDGETIEYDKKEPFKFDDSYKYRENPVGYFLQLRDCLAYLQDKYNYSNFDKHEKDFKLSKSSSDKETKLSAINEVDPDTQTNLGTYVLRKSGVYLMPNGGVMIKDAHGDAIILEGGKIYLQAGTDIVMQPLRHLVGKVGHSINLAAKQHIDFSSTDEGLRIKTEKNMHLFSKEGGVILQSDSENFSVPGPDDEAYNTGGGILLVAKDSGVLSYGQTVFSFAEELAGMKSSNTLLLQAPIGEARINAQNVRLLCSQTMTLACDETISIISGNSVQLAGTNNTSIGNKGERISMTPTPGSLPASLDGVLPVDDLLDVQRELKAVFDKTEKIGIASFEEGMKLATMNFRYLSSEKYNLDESDFLPMTIAQQDSEILDGLPLNEWEETDEEGTLPFPGKEKFEEYFLTSKIENLFEDSGDLTTKSVDDLKNEGKLSLKSLKEYKTR